MVACRFDIIHKHLRFCEYEKKVSAEEKLGGNTAWKVKKVSNLVLAASQMILKNPGEFLTVDEGIVKFRGNRCNFLRFNKMMKPQPCGLEI
jgi:hypothetical protein